MAGQKGGTRMDTIVKLVLIFFISLLSFAVGTFVGQGVSESEFREAQLERGDYNGFRGTASTDANSAEDAGGLTDEDIASLTEEFVNNEKEEMAAEESASTANTNETKTAQSTKTTDGYTKLSGNKMNDSHHAREGSDKEMPEKKKVASYKETLAPTAKEATRKGVAAASKEAARVADGKAPMEDPKRRRTPTSVFPGLSSSSVGKYTIQVASYPNEGEAKNHAKKLEVQGYEAFYLPASIKGKTWFRVSVGLYSSHKSATSARQQLLDEGRVAAAIVQKIVK